MLWISFWAKKLAPLSIQRAGASLVDKVQKQKGHGLGSGPFPWRLHLYIYSGIDLFHIYKNKICIYDWTYNWLMILYSAALANIWQWHEKRIPKLQNLWLSFQHVILALYWKSMSTLFKRFNSKPPTLIPWSSLARWLPAAPWPTREEVMKIVVDIHMI